MEDDRDAGQTLHELLQLDGNETRVAYDGTAALEQLDRWQPDVVLCDLSLTPRMDGLALVRAVRRDPRFAGVRLIAMSGYCSQADADKARAAGFETLVAKPLDLAKIRAALIEIAPSSGPSTTRR